MIGDDVRVVVLDVRGDTVRLGIEAPRNVQVHRAEVYAEVQAANAAAATRPEDLSSVAGRLTRLAGRPVPRPNPARRAGEQPEADEAAGTGTKAAERDEPAASGARTRSDTPGPAVKSEPGASRRPGAPGHDAHESEVHDSEVHNSDAPRLDAPRPDAPKPDAHSADEQADGRRENGAGPGAPQPEALHPVLPKPDVSRSGEPPAPREHSGPAAVPRPSPAPQPGRPKPGPRRPGPR